MLAVIVCGGPLLAGEMLEDNFKSFDASRWKIEGRGESGVQDRILRLTGCEAVAGDPSWTDYELSFRARVPKDASQVQIWASVRRQARDQRYAIGLRGGNNCQIYAARYATGTNQRFLSQKPLSDLPQPGEWVRVRIAVSGQKLKVYLNDKPAPVLEVSDTEEGWLEHGGIALGGGYLPAEYADVVVRPLPPSQDPIVVAKPARAQPRTTPKPIDAETEARRQQQRATYSPIHIPSPQGLRTEISLNRQWLFLPDYEFQKGVDYAAPNLNDKAWHVMDVPATWTVLSNWCYAENGGSDRWMQM